MTWLMDTEITFRGRTIGAQEIRFIQDLIDSNLQWSRRALSKEICIQWDWRQPNGFLRDGVCRTLLISLHRQGSITLPPVRQRPPNNIRGARIRPASVDTSLIDGSLKDLGSIESNQVRRTGPDESLFNSLIDDYHYLGYCRTVGEHIKYLIFAQDRPIACLLWGSAAWKVDCRDRFIGWDARARKANLFQVLNNTRFLILPWVRIPHLASHLLGQSLRRLGSDWMRLYAHQPVLAETFVDSERFAGTCYRAANWTYLGTTKGRGKYDRYSRKDQPVKGVFVYPLHKHFRRILCHG